MVIAWRVVASITLTKVVPLASACHSQYAFDLGQESRAEIASVVPLHPVKIRASQLHGPLAQKHRLGADVGLEVGCRPGHDSCGKSAKSRYAATSVLGCVDWPTKVEQRTATFLAFCRGLHSSSASSGSAHSLICKSYISTY